MAAIGEFEFRTLEGPAADAVPAPDPEATAAAARDELARARAEADAIRDAAREEGLALGRAAALDAVEPAAAALAVAAEGIRAEALAAADELERRAAVLAVDLAEKVVAGALGVRPELVVDAVRGALRGLVERERLTVLVHPDDLELVRDAGERLSAELGGIGHLEVQAERRVGRGGAVVRHALGDTDARVETKLERAREVVAEALRACDAP